MGCDASFLSKLSKKRGADGSVLLDRKVLLLGLDEAGKTTLLLQFKDNQFLSTVPTVGLNVE